MARDDDNHSSPCNFFPMILLHFKLKTGKATHYNYYLPDAVQRGSEDIGYLN